MAEGVLLRSMSDKQVAQALRVDELICEFALAECRRRLPEAIATVKVLSEAEGLIVFTVRLHRNMSLELLNRGYCLVVSVFGSGNLYGRFVVRSTISDKRQAQILLRHPSYDGARVVETWQLPAALSMSTQPLYERIAIRES